MRLWRESFEGLLQADVGLAPLALLTDEAAADLPAAVERFAARVRSPGVPAEVSQTLLGKAFVLSGLRYARQVMADLFRRINVTLEDSTTYQWILGVGRDQGRAEGRAEGRLAATRDVVMRFGSKRCGPPSESAAATLTSITDVGRLDRILDRADTAAGWDDLLSTP